MDQVRKPSYSDQDGNMVDMIIPNDDLETMWKQGVVAVKAQC
jgi:hypothetical protein